jgi:hypothetical protein
MDSVHQAARDSGMDDDQGNAMVGGILSFLKDHVSDDNYQRIAQNFPGADDAVQNHSRAVNTGLAGWIGTAVSTLDSKMNGNKINSNNSSNNSSGNASSLTEFGSLAGLVTYLAAKGISPNMVKQFLSFLVPLIQKKCGVDVSPYLGGIGGGSSSSTSNSASNATAGTSGTTFKDNNNDTYQNDNNGGDDNKFMHGIKSFFN